MKMILSYTEKVHGTIPWAFSYVQIVTSYSDFNITL